MNTADLNMTLLLLISIVYLLIIGFILKRRSFREQAVRLLVIYVATSFLWTLSQAALWFDMLAFLTEGVLVRVLLYELLLLSLLFFHLNWSFLRLKRTAQNWWILGVIWITIGIVLNENLPALPEVLWIGNGWDIQRQTLSFGVLIFGWASAMAGAMLLTVRVYHQTQEPLHRNRITYWSVVLSLAAAGAALFLAGFKILGSGVHTLGILTATYVMLIYGLPDMRQMARRTVSYLIITLLTVIIYTTGILVTQYVFQSVPGYNPYLAGATIALVLAIFFAPLLSLVQRMVNRLISGTSYDASRTLREYSTSISNILDLELLATVAVGLISETLDVRRGALFVVHHAKEGFEKEAEYEQDTEAEEKAKQAIEAENEKVVEMATEVRPEETGKTWGEPKIEEEVGNEVDAENGKDAENKTAAEEWGEIEFEEEIEFGEEIETSYFHLRSVTGMGEELPSGILSAAGPVATYLRRENHPLTQYDIDLLPRFQETSAPERTWLTNLNMVVYVPICAKGEWIGLLAFGPKVSGDRYFDNDLTLLSTLADQTAVALENARLFDDLKIRNTEIEQLNQELTEANRKLARLDQAKSDFIGVASHELRTPLTHIRGYNDMLGDMMETGALPPDNGLSLLQGVRKGVNRLENIVNTMFDVSKIDTETLDLTISLVSMASIVSTVVDTLAETLEERKQTLTVENLEDLPSITADGERLKQVFAHLIQNAIKYTPDGGQIRITGRLLNERTLPQHPTIEVVVADTGIGIAAGDLEHIFEKFYRVGDARLHSTGQTKFKGAGPGLGLTIAQGIVEAHGGRLWAESPGYDEKSCPGSKFHIILPVQSSRLELAGSETFITNT